MTTNPQVRIPRAGRGPPPLYGPFVTILVVRPS